MPQNPLELPQDRLSTIDPSGRRIFLYPADVHGYFKKRKDLVHAVLILIFLGLPWLKIGGHQAILLDLPRRQFAFFGIAFWADDTPMIFFILALLTFGLAFATALWGRVWCGWACPQTVFIENIFRRIERWIEGNHLSRKKLAAASWTFNKLKLRSFKWTLYFLVTFIITHSLLAYFVGADHVISMIHHSPFENWSSFLIVVSTMSFLLFDFGYFREQFCVVVCPYGRFQSVLMDARSLAVIYDERRGEPRRGSSALEKGDCVNCYKCVAVCPTGIDIRRGLQMECIACTACIDICDEVMEKIKKPKGLIRYSSEAEMSEVRAPVFRLRAVLYGAILALLTITFAYTLLERQPIHVAVIRAQEEPYKTLESEPQLLLNHFRLNIKNHTFDPLNILIKLSPELESAGAQLILPVNPLPIAPGKVSRSHIFIKFPKDFLEAWGQKWSTLLFQVNSKEIFSENISLIGPAK